MRDAVSTSGWAIFREASGKNSRMLGFLGYLLDYILVGSLGVV